MTTLGHIVSRSCYNGIHELCERMDNPTKLVRSGLRCDCPCHDPEALLKEALDAWRESVAFARQQDAILRELAAAVAADVPLLRRTDRLYDALKAAQE